MRGASIPALSPAALALALAACNPSSDHFAIRLSLTQGATDHCPSPACTGIPLSCDSVVSLRVVDAADPSTVYVSKCLELTDATNLCGIGAVDLGDLSVPNHMVRIQVLVWPRTSLPTPLTCPTDVVFDAQGMPGASASAPGMAPAIGGQTYFRPGEGDVASIELGCVDVGALNEASCRGAGTVEVHSTVDDFDTGVFLPAAVADSVSVKVGEPKPHTNPINQQIEWQLTSAELYVLPRAQVGGPVPAWVDDVPVKFQSAACIEVLEDGPQQTPAITCHAAAPSDIALELHAYRLAKSTLAQAFVALRLPGVPEDGLIVGIVVDHLGNPVQGATVLPSTGTIQYLSADRSMIEMGPSTTASGMFVSRDVPFDASWVAADSQGLSPTIPPVGGLVVGKATVIFIQLRPPPANE